MLLQLKAETSEITEPKVAANEKMFSMISTCSRRPFFYSGSVHKSLTLLFIINAVNSAHDKEILCLKASTYNSIKLIIP